MMGVFMFWYAPLQLVDVISNDSCHYKVVTTVISTKLMMLGGYVSTYHMILISVERYIAIVYPLHYESKFTDRTLKCAISAAWVAGITVPMAWLLWLIDADLNRCDLVPGMFYLLEVFAIYIPVCITMFICYGRILVIAWRHRQRIEPIDVSVVSGSVNNGPSAHTRTHTRNTDCMESAMHIEPAGTRPPGMPRSLNETTSFEAESGIESTTSLGMPPVNRNTPSATMARQKQRQITSRRREFKAVYLTAAIVGSFVILWFPNMLGRVLSSVGYNPVVVNYLFLVGGAIGTFNFSFAWVIYAAVSKSYRRAYQQVLIRIGCCCGKNVALQGDNSVIV